MADPTTGDLFKAKTITDDEVNAAVDGFMHDPTSVFRFANAGRLDLAAAVKAHPPAARAVVDPYRNEKLRRGMVRTAILLVWPMLTRGLSIIASLNLYRPKCGGSFDRHQRGHPFQRA